MHPEVLEIGTLTQGLGEDIVQPIAEGKPFRDIGAKGKAKSYFLYLHVLFIPQSVIKIKLNKVYSSLCCNPKDTTHHAII